MCIKLFVLTILAAVFLNNCECHKDGNKEKYRHKGHDHSSEEKTYRGKGHRNREFSSCLGQSVVYDVSEDDVNQFSLTLKYRLQPEANSLFPGNLFLLYVDGASTSFDLSLKHITESQVEFRTESSVSVTKSLDTSRECHELMLRTIEENGLKAQLFIDGNQIVDVPFDFPTSVFRVFVAASTAPALITKVAITDLKLVVNNEELSLKSVPEECGVFSNGKGKDGRCISEVKGRRKGRSGPTFCLGSLMKYDVSQYAVDTMSVNIDFKLTQDQVFPVLPRYLLQFTSDTSRSSFTINYFTKQLIFLPGPVISVIEGSIDDWHNLKLTIEDSKITLFLDGKKISGDSIGISTDISYVYIGAPKEGTLGLRGLVKNVKLEINNEEITEKTVDVPEECQQKKIGKKSD